VETSLFVICSGA